MLNKRGIILGGILVLITAVVYLNCLICDFVYDDHTFIVSNPKIKTSQPLHEYFTSYSLYASNYKVRNIYRPLRTLSFAIDYHFWKYNAFGYHLINYILHLLNVFLVFLFSLRLLGNRNAAFVVGLFFGLHPIQTEAVTWISSRSDLMFTFFIMLSLLTYIKHIKDKIILLYIASLFFFALGLLSKETAIILPLLIFLYNRFFLEERKFKLTIPYFITAALYMLIRFKILGKLTQRAYWGDSAYYTYLSMNKVFLEYIKLLLFPTKLSIIYPNIIVEHIFVPIVMVSIITVTGLFTLAILLREKNKLVSFSIFWFFICLLPVSNIFPLVALMAERFLYLPSIGFSVILTLTILHFSKKSETSKKLSIVMITVIALTYSITTMSRNFDYKNSYTMWTKTIQDLPNSYKAHFNLAGFYAREGMIEETVKELNIARKLKPDLAVEKIQRVLDIAKHMRSRKRKNKNRKE